MICCVVEKKGMYILMILDKATLKLINTILLSNYLKIFYYMFTRNVCCISLLTCKIPQLKYLYITSTVNVKQSC